ncbi:MAG: LysR family transcriptional regulator [Thermoleophilaceae bacterium]
MELRQLEHFVAVAEERQFTRAARRVHIVQSGLSASIRSLEEELGSRLFERRARHVELTEAGHALLDEARSVLSAAERGRDAVAAVQGLLRGHVHLGFMQGQPAPELPRALGKFHEDHPKVDIRMFQSGSGPLAEAVRTGRLDFAYVSLPRTDLNGLEVRPLGERRMMLAAGDQHALANRKAVTLEALRDETFIDVSRDWGTRIVTDRAFAAAGIERRIAFELNDLFAAEDLVVAGLGVAVMPQLDVTPSDGYRLIPITGSRMVWELSMVSRAGDLSPAAEELIRRLLEARDDPLPISTRD